MMTDSEVQLIIYLEALLRRRGYADVAGMLTAVVERELDRRAALMSPPDVEWRATG